LYFCIWEKAPGTFLLSPQAIKATAIAKIKNEYFTIRKICLLLENLNPNPYKDIPDYSNQINVSAKAFSNSIFLVIAISA